MGHNYYGNTICDKRQKHENNREKTKELDTSEDQILGEDTYFDQRIKPFMIKNTLSLCHTAILNAWDRIQELGKELNIIPGLNRTGENTLVTFYKN